MGDARTIVVRFVRILRYDLRPMVLRRGLALRLSDLGMAAFAALIMVTSVPLLAIRLLAYPIEVLAVPLWYSIRRGSDVDRFLNAVDFATKVELTHQAESRCE